MTRNVAYSNNPYTILSISDLFGLSVISTDAYRATTCDPVIQSFGSVPEARSPSQRYLESGTFYHSMKRLKNSEKVDDRRDVTASSVYTRIQCKVKEYLKLIILL